MAAGTNSSSARRFERLTGDNRLARPGGRLAMPAIATPAPEPILDLPLRSHSSLRSQQIVDAFYLQICFRI
jgi:hypothetical protein